MKKENSSWLSSGGWGARGVPRSCGKADEPGTNYTVVLA